MAGFLNKLIETQKHKTSKYLDNLLEKARVESGENSPEYAGIYNQYYRMPEILDSGSHNRRHYEAEMHDGGINGLERLYRRSIVIDLLSACAAECVYCLRGYYEKFALSDEEIRTIVKYCAENKELKEVLITGGDPFMGVNKLKFLITELASKAGNIKVVRIGTRLVVQDPYRFDDSFYAFFGSLKERFIIEVGCQINHYYELQPKTIEILDKLQKSGVRLYSQNVLLKNVNDDVATLARLYDELRYIGVIPHYLFHAVPMKGTDAFRTSVQKGIHLIRQLTSSGLVSGRAKPEYALMTDVGKVTLYQDSILGREDNYLLVKTEYKITERTGWNPTYVLSDLAFVNEDGTISVKYLDGND